MTIAREARLAMIRSNFTEGLSSQLQDGISIAHGLPPAFRPTPSSISAIFVLATFGFPIAGTRIVTRTADPASASGRSRQAPRAVRPRAACRNAHANRATSANTARQVDDPAIIHKV